MSTSQQITIELFTKEFFTLLSNNPSFKEDIANFIDINQLYKEICEKFPVIFKSDNFTLEISDYILNLVIELDKNIRMQLEQVPGPYDEDYETSIDHSYDGCDGYDN